MEEEDFDLQYADELDAMDNFDGPGPESSPPKPKRSLNFCTPVRKSSLLDELNDSLMTPLDSPLDLSDGSVIKQRVRNESETPCKTGRRDKRIRSNENGHTEEENNHTADMLDIGPQSKRQRVNGFSRLPDMDADDITPPSSPTTADKIVNLRNRTLHSHLDDVHDQVDDGYDFERKRVHTRVPQGNFISTRGTEGKVVYLNVKDEMELYAEYDTVGKHAKSTRLLTVSVEQMKDELETERQNRLLEEAANLTQQMRRNLDDGDQSDDDVTMETHEDPSDSKKILWVEKYAPFKYTDLLSEESINRTLLHWIKLWDFVVFGKDMPIKAKEKKKPVKEVKWKKNQIEVLDELDKLNRPKQTLVLLNGPPGLGKTTLAHTVAKHAGYNVVEINASDDRSAEVFKNKIEAATQMKAVMGAEPRPNCLIIDEIDGAPQPAINMLINLTKKIEEQATKKKKKDGGVLLRPIICICNDQYVPALRQLRQTALIMNFPPTEPSRLAARLYEVILRRANVNFLRIILILLKEIIYVEQHRIFCYRKKNQNSMGVIEFLTTALRFNNILHSTYAAGEYDKVIQGLFENYCECKYKDPKMEGLNFAMDWLTFVDSVNQYTMHIQDYSLMGYVPYIAVTFHLLFAANQPPRIQYPHSQYDALTKHNKFTNLVSSLMSDMSPSVRKYLNTASMTMEVLPPLMDIIQPNFRPVNTQLYSTREKEEMAQLIRIMIAYNMTYHQEKTIEGQFSYVLDPHVDEVVRFTGMKQHKQLTYAAKQLVAREIEMEKMRRNDKNYTSSSTPAKNVENKTNADAKKGPVIPNHKQKLQAISLNPDQMVQKDFFGRVIKQKTQDSQSSTQKDEKKKNVLNTDIWFHFKGGFSNAVRRNVRVQDLI
ncbi:chromosome transmission fidelity protein 18 [Mytilus galloprovincialis]|uniref:Chromosome transmission fidelity protein 18 n=1 Tax=Mytilus galloprovincialis TaxID=29158 RepID=A0A8B6E7I6_MYTGA|nr:chromosome transmission fidelity protein 18 [Mytilus galloprovincialis]